MSVQLIITIVVITLVVFLLMREVACWYFKINERNELLREQNRLLKGIIGDSKQNDYDNKPTFKGLFNNKINPDNKQNDSHWKCPKCNSTNSNNTFTCCSCGFDLNK